MSFPGKVNVFLTLPPGRGYNKTNWGAAPWMEAVPMAKIVKKSPGPAVPDGGVVDRVGASGPDVCPVALPPFGGALHRGVLGRARRLFRDRVLVLPDPEPEAPSEPVTTRNPEMDALMAERDRAVSEMAAGSTTALRMQRSPGRSTIWSGVTQKIFAHVAENPKKLPQIRRFLNYYLPTTLKLLNAYDRMDDAGVAGANIDGTMGKIEAMLDTVVLAYDKQLDALFADEALDISTDITVMEQMLSQEGLGGTQLGR